MKKKYVVEFGARGGAHTDNIVLSTELSARKVVANFVRCVGKRNGKGFSEYDWHMLNSIYRKSWQNETHFAAISLLDGVMRGAASARLWQLDGTTQGFKEESYD